MAIDAPFWRGRRVFLTGHTGFKGSWLAFWLGRLGARVTGYALAPPTAPSLFAVAGIAGDLETHVVADVRDGARLAAAVAAARPEVVFHLAAQPLVLPSYQDPVGTYATNVMGTVHLLDAVRRTDGVRAVVNVTSDKCYENRGWLWGYRENEPMGGRDPYSNSKGCAELVTAAFRQSFFGPGQGAGHAAGVATARAGNVVGGGDWAAYRLVPDLVASFADGRPGVVRNRHAVRPWQHVLDPLGGYLMLAEALWREPARFADGWNFGPGEEDVWPVHRLADRLAALWGEGAAWVDETGAGKPHEERTLALDCTKARLTLGWAPRWDTGATLAHTVAWYRAHQAGGDLRRLMQLQIDEHSAADATGRRSLP